jgi:NAD-dependent dihydropyrimidine dehydrogenase PreA subunit
MNMSTLRYLRNVTTLQLNRNKCTGCGMCLDVCPHEVFALEADKAVIADRDACMECGACQQNCPAGAISVRAAVGCAAGVIAGIVRGTGPTCDCGGESARSTPKKCC